MVATQLGAEFVPVSRVPVYPLDVRKAINIGFNRGTNDMKANDTPANMTEALAVANVDEAAAALPDIDPASQEFFPCLRAKETSVAELTKTNSGRWINYARNAARMLAVKGVNMPIVCTADNMVVNGIGRLQYAAERRHDTVPVVYITDEQARLSHAMLNLLSMDFDIHTRYADLLRYNSFRRSTELRRDLGRAFLFDLIGAKTTKQFSIHDPKFQARWKRHYGESVLDFGAGLLYETKMLRDIGVDCTPFEPYYLRPGTSDIDLTGSRNMTRKFLARVADGTKWQSIFVSAIFNSVPFLRDRQMIVRILAELAQPAGTVHACSAGVNQSGAKIIAGGEFTNKTDQVRLNFALGYEPRIGMGNFNEKPKVQKYHTPAEFQQLLREGFEIVKVSENSNNVNAACCKPKAIAWPDLEEAIRFEFDLPHPNSERLGLADEAIAAFRSRRKRLLTG